MFHQIKRKKFEARCILDLLSMIVKQLKIAFKFDTADP